MKNHLVLKKHISIVVLICFLVSQFGCVAYRPDEFKYSDHSIPLHPNKSIFLKKGDRLWEVVSLKMDDEVILFEILEQFNSERELSFVNYPRAHRVFILIHPGTNLDFNEDQQVQLPFSAIQEIQYYDVDEVRTAGLNFLTSIILLSVMASILVPEPKPEPEPAPSSGGGSSCPFIYVNNGSEYSFSGEIYSGAILPPIERHDYLPLPEITSLNGEYQLKITNEVHEIQHTNLIQLNAFDHPIDTKVLIDRHGTRHMLQSSFSEALSATNEMGVDILSELSETDRNLYIGDIRTDLSPLERLHLSFPIDKGQESAALVLNGRNSWWLDFMVREYFENFGGYYGKLIEKQSKISAEKINEWSIDQGIFL